MASSQQDHNVAQLNANEKAKVDKAIDEAKNFLGNNQNANATSQYQLAKVAGIIKNNQQRPVTIMNTHNFRGKFAIDPPAVISSVGAGFFLHEGAFSFGPFPMVVGSKAAIIYADSVLGWLVSWYRPDNADEPSKVYAEVGPKEKFISIDWHAIEKRLDDSSQPIIPYKDSLTGARIIVRIDDIGNKMAVLAAIFEANN